MRITSATVLLAASSLVLVSPVLGGGLALYEVGTPDVGLAAAGYAARAQDSGTVFTNPAGMTRLDGPEVLAGIQPLYGHVKFSPDSSTTTTGGDGGNAMGWVPSGSLFYSQPLSDRLSIGFGAFSYFGLGLDWDNDWVGRYYTTKATLVGMTLQPTVAYRVDEHFSAGVGANCMYAQLEDKAAVHNLAPGFGDGGMKLEDDTWGFGANVGALYEFNKATRVGVTYLSPVNLDFAATPKYSHLGPGFTALTANARQLDLGMTVPQMVMLSGYHELNDQFALLGSAGWQNWKNFGEVDVQVGSSNTRTTDIPFKDTWHGSLGMQYHPADRWTLSTGVAYDSSMLDDSDRTLALPIGETWRWGIGAQYALSKAWTLSLCYEIAYSGNLSVDVNRSPLAGHVSGDYADTAVHAIALSIIWKP